MKQHKRTLTPIRQRTLLVLGLSSLLYSPCVAPLCAAPAKPAANAPATPLLPAIEVSPSVLGANATVTLTLPENFPLSTSRLQVGLFEAGRPGRIADIRRDFKVMNGRLQATLNIQAEPGNYELKLVSGDKARTPISAGAPITVSGIQRRAGWWLLNGSPFAADSWSRIPSADAAVPAVAADTPFFISGLKRDLSRKSKAFSGISVPGGPLVWKTFELPPLTDMVKSGYDFSALQNTLLRDLVNAEARGERGFIGFALSENNAMQSLEPRAPEPSSAAVSEAVASLRTVLERVQPGSALILQIVTPFSPSQNTEVSDAAAPLCDGIVIRSLDPGSEAALWPVKVARRIAEEQPGYDLPVFHSSHAAGADGQKLDLWMAGATGLLSNAEDRPDWARAIERNLSLFVGSVTLEDIGVLPSKDTLSLYSDLRKVRRIPLLARLRAAGKGTAVSESFAIRLGDSISKEMVERLRQAASGGARIYLEGAPMKDVNGKDAPWELGSLVGGEAKPGPGPKIPVTASIPTISELFRTGSGARSGLRTTMTLEDGWMFGTGRGLQVPVRQTVMVTVNKGTVAGQAKQERGKDLLTEPRVAARLADGSPALIINPVGKGEVIWMPHFPRPAAAMERALAGADGNGDSTARGPVSGAAAGPAAVEKDAERKPLNVDRLEPYQRYYASVADYLQPALIHIRGNDLNSAGAEAVQVALRRSARGAYILALFNTAGRPAAITASVDGAAGVALDLLNEKEVALAVRGYASDIDLTLPARGYSLIAFAESRRALDEERNAPIGQAKLK